MEPLFAQYAAAFEQLDPVGIASFYRLPCAISDADGVQTFTDRHALERKFSQNCEVLRRLGDAKAMFQLLRVEPLTSQQVLAEVGWRVRTASSDIDFRTLYICHQIEQHWRFFSAHVYPGSFSHN